MVVAEIPIAALYSYNSDYKTLCKASFIVMKSVNRILATAGLQSLLERAAAIDGINQRLLRVLPSPFNEHVCFANVREDTAIIMADSGAWLTRVRYLGPEILSFLRQEPGLAKLKKVLFKIQPLAHHPEAIASRPQLSENTAELLISTAKVIDDPQLKAALHNLSRHVRKPG
jgi:hypothetical protein